MEEPEVLRGEIVPRGGLVQRVSGTLVPHTLNAAQFHQRASGNVHWLPEVTRGVSPAHVGKTSMEGWSAKPFEMMHGLTVDPIEGWADRVTVYANPGRYRPYEVYISSASGDGYSSNFKTQYRAQVAAEAMVNRQRRLRAERAEWHSSGVVPELLTSLKTGRRIPKTWERGWTGQEPREVPADKEGSDWYRYRDDD